MAVSANTLFHFTDKESLTGILSSSGFFAQYSDEHFEDILPPKSIYRISLIPLISFCDLTIVQISRDSVHTKVFGGYGIGLTKQWGIDNEVSPVIYVHKNSQPSNQLYKLRKLFLKYPKTQETHDLITTARAELLDAFKFIKPYQGRWQKGKPIPLEDEDVTYYHEREWRYCPSVSQYKVLPGAKKGSAAVKKKLNQKLKKKFVRFSPDEIKYIIIKEKKEIDEFVKTIKEMKITSKEKNELFTKIITIQEINEDF